MLIHGRQRDEHHGRPAVDDRDPSTVKAPEERPPRLLRSVFAMMLRSEFGVLSQGPEQGINTGVSIVSIMEKALRHNELDPISGSSPGSLPI